MHKQKNKPLESLTVNYKTKQQEAIVQSEL